MAVFKCKMCGGDLEILDNATVCECEYCGTKQTVPAAKTEALANLFNRANKLRIKCEFDKAEEIYEKILGKDETLAEAHWGLVLCKYGIAYVEDPLTEKRIPTCHRASYEAVTSDTDYLSAVEYADSEQKKIYKAEAKVIAGIQKRTLEIVKNEKPFDVFICYKETDKKGKRTVDSTYANDIYHQLTNEGFKVFYAAITLEDKLGQEYEPYIFAALNSAKVMLVIGSKEEYFNAVWVKNEWSRFLKLMKNDRSKLLIPCYKDIDPYDLPEEFAHLQAQDMGKIGFINDIVRGIKKVVATEEKVISTTIIQNSNDSVEPLLKRAFMFLEDGDFNSAREYAEKVLDIDPENANGYLVCLLTDTNCKNKSELKNCEELFNDNTNYKKVIRFGEKELVDELKNCLETINNHIIEKAYTQAVLAIAGATKKEECERIIVVLQKNINYKDSAEQIEHCKAKIEEINKAEEQAEKELERIKETKKKKLLVVLSIVAVIAIAFSIINATISGSGNKNSTSEHSVTEGMPETSMEDDSGSSDNEIDYSNLSSYEKMSYTANYCGSSVDYYRDLTDDFLNSSPGEFGEGWEQIRTPDVIGLYKVVDDYGNSDYWFRVLYKNGVVCLFNPSEEGVSPVERYEPQDMKFKREIRINNSGISEVVAEKFASILVDSLDETKYPRFNTSEDMYAISDIDSDGKLELIVSIRDAAMADMVEIVYDYNEDNDTVTEQFSGFPNNEYFDNGVVKAGLSHNHGLGTMWPYTLFTLSENETCKRVLIVDSWDKGAHPTDYEGNPFPDDKDKDGDGVIYYVSDNLDSIDDDSSICDETEYKNKVSKYLSGEKIELDWVSY